MFCFVTFSPQTTRPLVVPSAFQVITGDDGSLRGAAAVWQGVTGPETQVGAQPVAHACLRCLPQLTLPSALTAGQAGECGSLQPRTPRGIQRDV